MSQHWSIKDAAITRVTMIIFVALLLIMPAQAQPLPYPKGSGQCARDYVQSGSYCTAKNDRARAAIPKWRGGGQAASATLSCCVTKP